MAAKIKIEGVDTCLKQLEHLKKQLKTRVVRIGMTAATTPLLQTARQKCPIRQGGVVRGGLTRRSLGKKIKSYNSGMVVVGVVGARHGFRRVTIVDGKEHVQDPTKTLHLVEFGTQHSAAQPFLRQSLEANKGKFVSMMAARIQEEIDKLSAKG